MIPNLEPLKETDPRGFGGWTIKGRLGEGGYSTIFLGEKNHQLAAIKMIRSELLSDETVFNRFATEINNLERVDHPGIAKYLESDLSTDVPYIAVEYIEGETLEHRVNTRAPLKMDEWLDCLIKVADALQYCHEIQITHKDVSPGNIVLSNKGPKLIDFGISYHAGDQRVTQPDETIGTPAYMSPEHWDSEPRSEMDIFSLGSTFVFAGTGRSAFTGDSKQEIRRSIWHMGPNLEGLNQLQTNLLVPLLYKDFEDRAKLKDLIEAVNQVQANRSASVFENYLKNREKKLVKDLTYLEKGSRQSKPIILGSIMALATISYFFYTNSFTPTQSPIQNMGSTLTDSMEQPALVAESPSNSTSKLSSYVKDEEDCVKLVNSERLEDALPFCQTAADLGSSKAQHNLGFIFDKKLGNYEMARYWYEIAGANGEAMSYFNLGVADLYVDRKKSINYFKECSELKLAQCTFNVATMYEKEGKIDLAKKWYEKAISQGDGGSARNLGNIYTNEENWAAAKNAFLRGSKLNDFISQYNYGVNLWSQFGEKSTACEQFKRAYAKSNSTYSPSLEAYMEKCKNLNWSISENVYDRNLPIAPYRSINVDYYPGSWVIAGGNGELNEAGVSFFVQSRTQGSNQSWQYRFYIRVNHTNGPSFIVKGDPKLPSECLEFRIVGEKQENLVSHIFTLPKSSCKNNLDYYKLLSERVSLSGDIPSEITPRDLDGLPFLSTETNQWIIPIDKLDGTGPVVVGQINLLVDKAKNVWLQVPYTPLSKQGKRNYISVDAILVNGRCPQFRILEIDSAKVTGVWLKPLPLECGT